MSNCIKHKAKAEIIIAMLKISVFVQQCQTIQYLSFNLPTIYIILTNKENTYRGHC